MYLLRVDRRPIRHHFLFRSGIHLSRMLLDTLFKLYVLMLTIGNYKVSYKGSSDVRGYGYVIVLNNIRTLV